MVMEITFDGDKVISAHHGDHIIRTDQPLKAGGGNSAPAPFDLFLASIGTCAGIYVKGFCDNRKIPTDGISIVQTVEFNRETGLPVSITVDIKLPAGFPEKYKAAVLNVADLCKVKKVIASPPVIRTIVSTAE